ncbi:hypothetical protein ACZ90_31815 [Streptomyces albus subsp. albus]|nr:hypothetical protein ACZ90_31815 [Streptomyces albus subsp. albus]
MPSNQQPVHLEARTVSGHVVKNSPISGDVEAQLTDNGGQPISGRDISFYSTASRQKIGTATTDQTGTAGFNSGSKITDPVMVASTLASGVDAKFAGDSEYQPAQAHADLNVGA